MGIEANDTKYVTAGKPKIGGSIFTAPVGTTLPKDTTTQLDPAFKCLGYADEDGLTNVPKKTVESKKAWGGDTVLNTQTESNDDFKVKLIEVLRSEVLKTVRGAKNVTGELATGLSVNVNGSQPEDQSWVFELILTGGVVERIVIPKASITELGEIKYNDKDPVGYEITLSAMPDKDGNTHYEYYKGA